MEIADFTLGGDIPLPVLNDAVANGVEEPRVNKGTYEEKIVRYERQFDLSDTHKNFRNLRGEDEIDTKIRKESKFVYWCTIPSS